MFFVTQDGDSALMTAAENGHTDVVMELVKAGANKDLQNVMKNVDVVLHRHFFCHTGWRLSTNDGS